MRLQDFARDVSRIAIQKADVIPSYYCPFNDDTLIKVVIMPNTNSGNQVYIDNLWCGHHTVRIKEFCRIVEFMNPEVIFEKEFEK